MRFVLGAQPVEVPRWVRASDVACLVSTVEGFGLAPIEALACGRPVVVSREVPSGVAVTEGRTGAICDAHDVAGMAAALERAAALRPGEEARAAALPYAVTREAARAVDVLRPASRAVNEA